MHVISGVKCVRACNRERRHVHDADLYENDNDGDDNDDDDDEYNVNAMKKQEKDVSDGADNGGGIVFAYCCCISWLFWQ